MILGEMIVLKGASSAILADLLERYPVLGSCRNSIYAAGEMLIESYSQGGKLLICGNGGSCADCDHIAGELLKGFMLRRPVSAGFKEKMNALYGEEGEEIASKLQQGLPAISLAGHAAANSAFANDVDPSLVYAQQVLAYGKEGDALIGISTSGNAVNVAAAVKTANALGIRTIGLTGRDGGDLARLARLPLTMPERETYRIQEQHIAVYHLLCTIVEYELFDL